MDVNLLPNVITYTRNSMMVQMKAERQRAENYRLLFEKYFAKCLELNESNCRKSAKTEELECRMDVAEREVTKLKEDLAKSKSECGEWMDKDNLHVQQLQQLLEHEQKLKDQIRQYHVERADMVKEIYEKTKRVWASEVERLDDITHEQSYEIAAMKNENSGMVKKILNLEEMNAKLRKEALDWREKYFSFERFVTSTKGMVQDAYACEMKIQKYLDVLRQKLAKKSPLRLFSSFQKKRQPIAEAAEAIATSIENHLKIMLALDCYN